jgi:hypothetical protein
MLQLPSRQYVKFRTLERIGSSCLCWCACADGPEGPRPTRSAVASENDAHEGEDDADKAEPPHLVGQPARCLLLA